MRTGMLIPKFIDGRWVTDDYYESKVLAEISAKGILPGDLVGELPDPNAPSHIHQADATVAGGSSSVFPSFNTNLAVAGGGIYRAGGPTTIFGGSGWGPFSDGPLNAVRKSLLSRDGVTEENWMWMMSSRVQDADNEWARLRKEGRGKEGLSVDGIVMGGKGTNWTKADTISHFSNTDADTKIWGAGERTIVDDTKGIPLSVATGKNRQPGTQGGGAIGVYEPHTNLILCESTLFLCSSITFYLNRDHGPDRADTQPTRARWESLSSPERRVLGGTKAGNGAWGLAWVDTVMQLPDEDEDALKRREEEHKEREAFIKEVEMSTVNLRGTSIVSVHGGSGGRGESEDTRDVSVMSFGV